MTCRARGPPSPAWRGAQVPHFRTGIQPIFAQDGGTGNWIGGAGVKLTEQLPRVRDSCVASKVAQACASALHCGFEHIFRRALHR